MNELPQILNPEDRRRMKHAYDVEVDAGFHATVDIKTVRVFANNRTQAALVALDAGTVRSINMVG